MALNEAGGGGGSAKAIPGPSAPWSVLYGAGMALVFTGERVIGTGKGRLVCSALGLLCVLLAMAVRIARGGGGASPDRRVVEQRFLMMYALGLLSVALYALQSDLPTLRGGKALEATSPKLATVLAAIWPALWAAATFAIVGMELAYAPMRRAPRVETGRVQAAQLSGLGIAGALVFALSLGYVTSERDKKVDLAYFRTTRPGESTRRIVQALDQPLTVGVFFPSANEVREEVDSYFNDLAKESNQLKLEHYDFDLDPGKAKELGVSANGIVVFARGGRKEQLPLQLQIENARTSLKNLDKEVQQRLLQVSRPARITFLTQGHGERTPDPGADNDHRPGVRELRNALTDQGHDVRDLGPAEGLATEIPKEATLVMVVGPTKPFAPEEMSALQRYLDRGGRLYLALDPDGGVDFHELLAPLGVKLGMKTLANDQAYGRRTHENADRINLISALYSSHASVSTLSRYSGRAPVLLVGAGAVLGPTAGAHGAPEGAKKDVYVDMTVHAHAATFNDDNGNFQADANETRKAWELAAAITKKSADKPEQRLFVVGDSDFLTDRVVGFYGNPMLVLDPVRWLIGEESFAGQTSTEADVPVEHTRKQDVAWFYSSVFVAPMAIVGLGLLITRRRRRGRRADAGPGAGAAGMGAPLSSSSASASASASKGAQP